MSSVMSETGTSPAETRREHASGALAGGFNLAAALAIT
jgi:hypothetical protein